jgi:hypothetical protein
VEERIDLKQPDAGAQLDQALALYLIMRDLLTDLNAVAAAGS